MTLELRGRRFNHLGQTDQMEKGMVILFWKFKVLDKENIDQEGLISES